MNLGQLVREHYGADKVVLVGFAGGSGEVIAARERGGAMNVVRVPPPRDGSVEALLAEAAPPRALLVFPKRRDAEWLTVERGHRAIGVVYDTDVDGDRYVPTRIGGRYDALCWFNWTTPVRALHLGDPETLRFPDDEERR